ncbi:MAG TPA: hypothetical protein VH164_02915 [Ktedonobacteraceae bacterium]|nr:hypothetical protein [Ktedonobacteraceae bacterium]
MFTNISRLYYTTRQDEIVVDPLDVLKLAGVDLSIAEPIETTFEVLAARSVGIEASSPKIAAWS